MKTIIKLFVACALALTLAACGSTPTKSLSEANMAIKAANKANGIVKKLYAEWRHTGKIIKKARKAKGTGNFDKAVKLANKAERQAKDALAQYNSQKNNKMRM